MKQDKEKFREKVLDALSGVNRPIKDLVDFLDQSDFWIAPASTNHHGNYEAGLAKHSYEVYQGFKRQVEHYQLPVPFESVVLSGICHDFCKIRIYQSNSLKSGKISDSKPYKVEDKFPFGHGEKSVVIANRFIKLTEQEELIIRWHMGSYDPAWEHYKERLEKDHPEVVLFQHIDKEVSLLRGI